MKRLPTVRVLGIVGFVVSCFTLAYFIPARVSSRIDPFTSPTFQKLKVAQLQRAPVNGTFVVFLTSSNCAAAVDTGLPSLLERKLFLMAQEAQRAGVGWGSAAVAVDESPIAGFLALTKLRGFQEFASGGGKANRMFEAFFRGINHGIDVTPSIAVAIWHVTADDSTARVYKVVDRYVGLDEIRRWAVDSTPRAGESIGSASWFSPSAALSGIGPH